MLAGMHVPLLVFFGGHKMDARIDRVAGATRHYHVRMSSERSLARRVWRHAWNGHAITGHHSNDPIDGDWDNVPSMTLLTWGIIRSFVHLTDYQAPCSRFRRLNRMVEWMHARELEAQKVLPPVVNYTNVGVKESSVSNNTPNTPNTCLLYTSPSPRD